ncbi:MAG: hypothetical protein LBH65_05265 [Desulfovibrio sp.]|jgi:hypothetical protein|nr:hypothetical protein [Desulfovibrio sp.]
MNPFAFDAAGLICSFHRQSSFENMNKVHYPLPFDPSSCFSSTQAIAENFQNILDLFLAARQKPFVIPLIAGTKKTMGGRRKFFFCAGPCP